MSVSRTSSDGSDACRYWAFISYSSKDKAWARWLHRSIETYGIPAQLVSHLTPAGHPAPKRFHPLFHDRAELAASADLGAVIEEALSASRYLIVVCSRHAAQSRWVNKEIETFQKFARHARILAVIVDGEPNAGDKRECFPPALRQLEPIAADARPQGDGKHNAKLKLLAGMLGVSLDSLKQRDTQRRIRRLQVVAATLFIVASAFAGLAWYANDQKRRAVNAREQAEKALELLVYDMRDELVSVGRLDLADKVKRRVDEYYQRLGIVKDNPETLLNRAAAFENAGNLALDKGDLTGALKEYRAAMTLAERLVGLNPDNAVWQQGLSVSQIDIGRVFHKQRNLDGALAAYLSALRIRQKLATAHPSDVGYQTDLGVCHERIGAVLLDKGDLNGALREFRTRQEIVSQLATKDPSNSALQRDLAVSHMKIGDVLMAQGDPATVLTAYQASLDILKKLEAQDPSNASLQRDLSGSHEKIGDALQAQGDSAAAAKSYEAAVSLRKWLIAADPSNPGRRYDLWIGCLKLGDVLLAKRDFASASDAYRDGLTLAKQLTEYDPTNLEWQRSLALAHDRMGRLLQAQNDLTGALSAHRASLEIARRWADVDPSNLEWQQDLYIAYLRIGDVLESQGDLLGALASYQTNRSIVERLATRAPQNREFQRALWSSYYNLGALSERTDPENALRWWRKALDILLALKQSGARLSSQDEKILERLRDKLKP